MRAGTVFLRFSPLQVFESRQKRQGEPVRDVKATEYMFGIGAVVVGIGLYSYYVRELLASLALFTGAFLILGMAALGVFLVWSAAERIAVWAPPASRSMFALSRRLIAAYARS